MAGFDLDRFVTAQDAVGDTVRRELAAGRKRTHWMWFVFPQLRSLGRSDTARFYGLDGAAEARAFLRHPTLGPRLLECTRLADQIEGRTALEVFGTPDDLKFRSCLTLFAAIEPAPFESAPFDSAPFDSALRHYFDGVPDRLTLELLHAA